MTENEPLSAFGPAVRAWFAERFAAPTRAQRLAWPPIARRASTLLIAPTGSGKTLAAFLAAIERLMFEPEPPTQERLRVLYVSPLKALASDVERNLQAPLAGIQKLALARGFEHRALSVALRTGDTPARERARFARAPADILITTPESLFLLLTSRAALALGSVEVAILDEIHAVAGSKRGAHLALSLERLEALRRSSSPLQRIGLSATARPLEEIGRLLVGGSVDADGAWRPRPVEIVDAGATRALSVTVQVPVEDMARPAESVAGELPPGASRHSIWPAIHPKLVELIEAHRSTMIFANSRRLCERLAAAINETAGKPLARAHHGSLAREQRTAIEEQLKRGALPAIVATSSLELGIDMGAVDLVIQIEAPPSVTSGLQRVGRAGHSVGEVSQGVIVPKFRGDLLACAAAASRMADGLVEATAYPRNPLDVLAQQVVAMVATGDIAVHDLHALVRRAAPFAELSRASLEGVLDMLSGRYPSDEFAELKARITWDRAGGVLSPRRGARRMAVVNAGTIPDRGLYGVFLAGQDTERPVRVGELDEEMVFESREGEVFVLGASSWRIDRITHDRVLVTPAPGLPGKMPFWHGDRPGRPLELGEAIGRLARTLVEEPAAEALERLGREHGLERRAAENLLAYLIEQREATGEVPSDRVIVVERFVDEMGDWRVCVLTPFGSRVHAPWAMAALGRARSSVGGDVEAIWSDDGMVFRLPEADAAPELSLFVPGSAEIEELVFESLGTTALFATRFRENAARALLLPRRHPGRRSPLWAQRKRAADLLGVASRYGAFPILLETYRECLRDVFDVPALTDLLRRIETRELGLQLVDRRAPSPFAASLMFSYVANFIYGGDTPLAERRAQALSVNHAELRELLGEAELRELFDTSDIASLERRLQRLEGWRVADADGVHDLLLALGDLSRGEIGARSRSAAEAERWLEQLERAARIVRLRVAGQERFCAVEDAARWRDALGVALPESVPAALREPVADPLGDVVGRYARTHGPFVAEDVVRRLGLDAGVVRGALERLAADGRLVEGEFLPAGRGTEWCDAGTLARLKEQARARLRKQIEPVDAAAYARFLLEWQGVATPGGDPDALLAAVEQLAGAPLVASELDEEILPARVRGYRRSDLDALCAAGRVVWRGLEPLGENDGRVALYTAEQYPLLAPAPGHADGELAARLRAVFEAQGAVFFAELVVHTGAFPHDVAHALWDLVWAGEVTNDTLAPLRSRSAKALHPERRHLHARAMRRAAGVPGTEGRWSLLSRVAGARPSETECRAALARALLARHGVVTRESVRAEGVPGGFSAVYEVLGAMEHAGRVRRGYFVAGLGAAQFAMPGAAERLRALGARRALRGVLILAANDPANAYGAALAWPAAAVRPARAAGAHVVLKDGALVGFIGRRERSLVTFLPPNEPERSEAASALAGALSDWVDSGARRALLISDIDGALPSASPLAQFLTQAGFRATGRGYLKRADALPRARSAPEWRA